MTLATHIVTGAAAAELFSTHPAQAFFIGWATHYIFDSIAHWDYPLKTFVQDKNNPLGTKIAFNKFIFLDMGKVLFDIGLGLIIILILGRGLDNIGYVSLILGALGGVFPDFLQFLFGTFKFEPLTSLQKFHNLMHSEHKLDNQPIFGIVSQIVIIGVVVAIFYSGL